MPAAPDPRAARPTRRAAGPLRGRRQAAELAALTDELGAIMRGDDLVGAAPDPRRARRGARPARRAPSRCTPSPGPTTSQDRLDDDRRCFVLEHPALPGRPLNVVWCALWRGVPRRSGRDPRSDGAAPPTPQRPTPRPSTRSGTSSRAWSACRAVARCCSARSTRCAPSCPG